MALKQHIEQPLTVSSLKAERGEGTARFNADTMMLSWEVYKTFKFKDERFGRPFRRKCENGFEICVYLPNEKLEPAPYPIYRWTKVKGRKPYTMIEIDARVLITK